MNKINIADFDLLVQNHSHEIYNYLWRMLRDSQDAEDAMQETFTRAFRGFPRLQNTSNLRAWLYKIATNVAYTQRKRTSRYNSQITGLSEFPALATSDNLEIRDAFEAVMQAIEQLPHKQRISLILRNYQGCDYQEIAEALDCSPASARSNVYQALKKLRSQFAEKVI